MTFRSYQVQIGSTLSEIYIQEEGVPQGSVLSVTLFAIKINNILNQLPPTVCSSLYVDDLQKSCHGKEVRFIEHQLQTAVNCIMNWNEKIGFNLSLHLDPEIFIGTNQITVSDCTRFLGIHFGKKNSHSSLTFSTSELNVKRA